jgi:alkanesulfonate monooxygenase SsuD/methylene tetrahydromethanopterin reductase-like flavin-dependent oxidoreductase (luciferase family)
MDVGLNVRDYIDDPTRPLHEQLDEAADIFRQARGMGFTTIYMPQHFIAHPTRWPQPMEILSRLAPDAEGMRLMTGILLLTYLNPVDIAEQVATLDQISNGRFTLGVGLGYVEKELEAFGTNRAERVSRLEESIALMKELWTGEEVNHEGKHWTVRGGRMGMTPVQKPHPPIWLAAQSRGAVRRAARIADACLMGPQPKWEDIDDLAAMYWEAIAEQPGKTGHLTASRSISVARDRETAISEAIAAGEAKAGLYTNFNMQESTTVDLGLDGSRDLDKWAIVGSPQDCAETIMRCHEANDLDHIGLGALNLPKGKTARLEYLQLISEEVLPLLH